MKVIDKMISKRGFINFDARTNSIIMRDLESNLELISGVIKSIDTVTPQVMIETKVIETDLDNTENLGIDWVLQASISGASPSDHFSFYTDKGWTFGQGGPTSYTPANVTAWPYPPLLAQLLLQLAPILLTGPSMPPSFPPPCKF